MQLIKYFLDTSIYIIITHILLPIALLAFTVELIRTKDLERFKYSISLLIPTIKSTILIILACLIIRNLLPYVYQ